MEWVVSGVPSGASGNGGVYTTAAGYAGGHTANPTYDEVCSGLTGHSDGAGGLRSAQISYQKLLAVFWESHDPTQGMRQGNDIGTQYRSVICCRDSEQLAAEVSMVDVPERGWMSWVIRAVTTEVRLAPEFCYAEYHQQYLAKNHGLLWPAWYRVATLCLAGEQCLIAALVSGEAIISAKD